VVYRIKVGLWVVGVGVMNQPVDEMFGLGADPERDLDGVER
jgi:hypothetical protein